MEKPVKISIEQFVRQKIQYQEFFLEEERPQRTTTFKNNFFSCAARHIPRIPSSNPLEVASYQYRIGL